ncbi:MAG: exonuclease SbcCD subunit D [Microscillaceae bacterium]|nr:exonuclease SbcCD subunit D [Microscillaceae bacterium]
MKILHTADWHLGKSFNNYNLLEEQAHVLHSLVSIVREHKPDVMLLAGDIYDRSVPPAEAVRLFDEIMSEIILELKVSVICIAGNHDNPERINYCNYLLKKQGLHIFGNLQIPVTPVILKDSDGEVYFYPVPFTEPEVLRYFTRQDQIRTHEDVMRWIIQDIQTKHPKNTRSVLIGHAFISGGTESESERQLMVGGSSEIPASIFSDFNYVALGHLHQAQDHFLNGRLQYAGSVLKYSFSEAHHQKSVVLIDMDKSGLINSQRITLKPRKDVKRIQGFIQDRTFHLSQDVPNLESEDFLEVTLENVEIVPNAMQIVQKIYPNATTLKWPNLNRTVKESRLTTAQINKMNESELFMDFYKRFVGKELDEDKKTVLHQTIKKVKKD